MDRLVALACAAMGCENGVVSVLGPEETVFRASVGLDMDSIASEISVTRKLMAMGCDGLLVVEDAPNDPRVRDHPLVTAAPFVRFFAGATICDASGLPVGLIGVMNPATRGPLSEAEVRTLRRFAGLAGDLIDQAAAARRSQEQLSLLRLAGQISGVGHWRYDLPTDAVTWSDEVYRIHGLEPGAIDPTYGDVVGFYHPDDAKTLCEAVARAVETGEGYDLSLRLTPRAGELRQVVVKAVTERDELGAVTTLFGVFQDITEATQAKVKLERSEALFRLLSEEATDIVARYSPDAVFRYLSPAVETILGREPETMIGRRCGEFIHPDDLPRVETQLRDYVKAGRGAPSPRFQYRALRADGEWVWLEAAPRGVFDEAGQLVEIHDHVRDITERKALEHQLIEARDKAEAAAQAKSEFLANMSHELRTPLTSVIGFSGLLISSEGLGESERRFADRIATASDSLLCVINDILDYSKLEAEAVELEVRPFEPRRMVEAATSMIEGQALLKGLRLTAEVSEDTPTTLLGDEGRLRQVALNFLSNALKFTASGEVRLKVDWRDGGMRLQVADTGIGADPEKLDALFDRFTQADTSTTRTYGGTGLGLAISRRIVEMMHGRIGATSTPGEGSTFWFEVPLAVSDTSAKVVAPVEEAPMIGLRVLMADDAPANRELVPAMLRGLGIFVHAVEDGVEAVEAASVGGFDLILMDMNMPNMDGIEATRAIRALRPGLRDVPILALSAAVQPEQIERCRAAGMNGHVGKPIRLEELLSAMDAVLGDDGETAVAEAC